MGGNRGRRRWRRDDVDDDTAKKSRVDFRKEWRERNELNLMALMLLPENEIQRSFFLPFSRHQQSAVANPLSYKHTVMTLSIQFLNSFLNWKLLLLLLLLQIYTIIFNIQITIHGRKEKRNVIKMISGIWYFPDRVE